jgi:hypothetical protein
MRGFRGVLVAGIACFAAGCMQFDYGVTLEEDLSGTADVDVTVDLDRVAYLAAYIQNAFEGEGGEPSEEQIQAAREDILTEMDEDDDFSEASMRAEIEPDLPEGVVLVFATVDREDLRTKVDMRFAFDHVSKLREIRLDADDESDDAGAPVDSEPFEDLEIVEDGDEIIVRSQPINPVEEMGELDDTPFVTEAMVEKLLEGFSITFRLTSPFKIEEHNATRKEGKTLVWEFNLQTLESGEATGIYARLKR